MVKQYVNLPPDAAKHYGAKVTLEVQASSLSGIGVAEWWVEAAAGATNTDPKYLAASARARVRKTLTKNEKSVFRNQLLLPHVGGDKYHVKCAKQGRSGKVVDVEEFETWRKVFYTVHYMNAPCLATFNSVKAKFEAAFGVDGGYIELEQVATMPTLKDEPNTPCFPYCGELPHLYNAAPPLTDKPWHLRIVMINDIYDPKDDAYSEPGVSTLVTTIATNRRLADFSPRAFLRSARARVEPGGRWYGIKGCVKKISDRLIEVDVSRRPHFANAINGGGTILIEIETTERAHYCGHSLGNFCCVRTNEPGGLKTVLQTFTHEVGHSLQQAVRSEPLYDGAGNRNGREKNPMHHTGYGGNGPHCHKNAKIKRTKDGRMYVWDSGTLCTMYLGDEPHVDPDGKFCAEYCVPRLKRIKMTAGVMRNEGWNDY